MNAASKCTKSTPGTSSGPACVKRTHGEGVSSCLYAYDNDAPRVKEFVSCGIELAVHLRGDWHHKTATCDGHSLAANEIVRVTSGVTYRHQSRGATKPGSGVGLVVFGETLRALQQVAGGELRFPGDAGMKDAELVELATAMARGELLDPRAAVLEYVERHADVVVSPLVRAKHELERWFTSDLSIPMLAETGGLSATSFTRRFLTVYGTTPARYRLMLRANAAARMLWMNPDMPTKTIGEECGFFSPSYFFRTFRQLIGMTPTAAREQHAAHRESYRQSLTVARG